MREFERACRFDPMEAPRDPANRSEGEAVEASADGATEQEACGEASEGKGEASEVLEVGLDTVT